MSKRDLWLHEDLIEAEDPRFDYFVYDGTIYDKPHPGLIHYRKVNPALDLAILEMEKALLNLSMAIDCIGAGWIEAESGFNIENDFIKAREVLTKIKSLREQK